MGRRVLFPTLGSHVESHERFTGTGNARHEDDGLLAVPPGLLDDGLDPRRGPSQIDRTRIIAGDGLYGVAGVQRAGGLNDSGCRVIWRAPPSFAVNLIAVGMRGTEFQGSSQFRRVATEWRVHSIDMGLCPGGHSSGCFSRNENRKNLCVVAGAVEVLEIEGVVPYLIDIVPEELPLADLKFDRENQSSGYDDRVDATAEAGDVELHEDVPVEPGDGIAEYLNRLRPRPALVDLNMELTSCGETSEQGIGMGGTKGRDWQM